MCPYSMQLWLCLWSSLSTWSILWKCLLSFLPLGQFGLGVLSSPPSVRLSVGEACPHNNSCFRARTTKFAPNVNLGTLSDAFENHVDCPWSSRSFGFETFQISPKRACACYNSSCFQARTGCQIRIFSWESLGSPCQHDVGVRKKEWGPGMGIRRITDKIVYFSDLTSTVYNSRAIMGHNGLRSLKSLLGNWILITTFPIGQVQKCANIEYENICFNRSIIVYCSRNATKSQLFVPEGKMRSSQRQPNAHGNMRIR